MWFKWLHIEERPTSERPTLWWQQLESAPRTAMPFAHLFPQPPSRAAQVEGEATKLVKDLVQAPVPERMEDIVKTYQQSPAPDIEPIEAWQVESISRLDTTECDRWGADGGQIVDWFDHGELLAAWPTSTSAELEAEAAPRGIFARFVAWFKGLFKPAEQQLELANAEL